MDKITAEDVFKKVFPNIKSFLKKDLEGEYNFSELSQLVRDIKDTITNNSSRVDYYNKERENLKKYYSKEELKEYDETIKNNVSKSLSELETAYEDALKNRDKFFMSGKEKLKKTKEEIEKIESNYDKFQAQVTAYSNIIKFKESLKNDLNSININNYRIKKLPEKSVDVKVDSSWGYSTLGDYITVKSPSGNSITIRKNKLPDGVFTSKDKELFKYLTRSSGKHFLRGQTPKVITMTEMKRLLDLSKM